MRTAGWIVLTLVFLDEVAALVALGVWGADVQGWPLATAAVVVAALAWNFFASPKAQYGGPVVRPAVKVLVFGLATAALWSLDRPALAVAFLVFSVVVNALAQLPSVRALHPTGG